MLRYAIFLIRTLAVWMLLSVASIQASSIGELSRLTEVAWQRPNDALKSLEQREISSEASADSVELAWIRACAHFALLDSSQAEHAIQQGLRWQEMNPDAALRLRALQALLLDLRGFTTDALKQSAAVYADSMASAHASITTKQFAAAVDGGLRTAQNDFTNGLPILQRNLESMSADTAEWLRLQTEIAYIDALSWSGNWQEAWRLSQQVISRTSENRSGLLFGYLYSQFAWMVVYEKGVNVGLEWQQRYRQQTEKYGSDLNQLFAALAVAFMLADADRNSEAKQLLERVEPIARATDLPYPMIRWLQLAARIASNLDQEKEAMTFINEAIARNEKLQANFLQLLLRDQRAQILASFGHLEQAMAEQGKVMESRLAALQKENQAKQQRVNELSTELAAREAELLRQDNALQALQIEAGNRRNRALLIGVSVAALLITALLWLLWRNSRISQRLRELADTDVLTGLPNRRALMQRAETEFVRSRRYPEPFSIAVIDLDFFKQINDQFGHEIGDQVLKQFAQMCRQELRATDYVGRTGGEEFVLLMPHTDSDAALRLAERLRQQVELISEGLDVEGVLTQASFGVASALNDDASFKQLLIRADNALYRAKAEGRNQVQQAPGTAPAEH